MASVPVKVDYSVERFTVNGNLVIYEDDLQIDEVVLTDFKGTDTYTNTFESDVVGTHTYKAVLTVTTLEDPPVTVSVEDSTSVIVYEGPAIEDIEDQTAPFTPFDLDAYLLLPDPFFSDYTVEWTASDPGDGWTVGIDPDNVVTVAAPVGANDPMTITFTATTTVTCGEGTSIIRNSDDATFIPNQPPDVSDANPSIKCIWPPNHKFVDITIEGVTDPDGDAVTITITGTGNGRVYEISFVASDGNGGETAGSVIVEVPHDKKDCGESIDDGQNYDATEIN